MNLAKAPNSEKLAICRKYFYGKCWVLYVVMGYVTAAVLSLNFNL